MNLFGSKGLKRKIAAFLAIVIGALTALPNPPTELLSWLQVIAGVFGGVGLAHGAFEGTVATHSAASFSSFFTVILSLLTQVPFLAPLAHLLTYLAALFGVSAVSKK